MQCGIAPSGDSYRIIQDPRRFCFGIDAVYLSNFAKIKKGETVLDLGTGTGVIPILLCAKTKAAHIRGLEIQKESVEMARRSVEMNHLADRIQIDQGDIKNGANIYPPNHFDAITVNPPYIPNNSGITNQDPSKAIARHEIACTLADICALSSRLLKTGGRLYMVHRPQRLAEIFATLKTHNLEPKTIQLIQSQPNHQPSLVLIEATDHGRPMLKVLPCLIIQDQGQNQDQNRGALPHTPQTFEKV